MLATSNFSRDNTGAYYSSPACKHDSHKPLPLESPMLTPSPLSKRSIFSHRISRNNSKDTDDLFATSPLGVNYMPQFCPLTVDASTEDEGGNPPFVSDSDSFFSSSEPQPLRTPVKRIHRVPSRQALSTKSSGAQSPLPATGNKRKSITPLRTPLHISTPTSCGSGIAFNRLAPLPAPRFTPRVQPTKAETEVHLITQADTMTHLTLCDADKGLDEFEHALFSAGVSAQGALEFDGDIADDISPNGHVNKRRARTREISDELLAVSPSDKGRRSFSSKTFQTNSHLSNRNSPTSRRHEMSQLLSPTPQSHQQSRGRAQLSRFDSAALFFGPIIQRPSRQNGNTTTHSPTGWKSTHSRAERLSKHNHASDQSWDEEDILFGVDTARDTPFLFNLTVKTPSPRSKHVALSKKFKPRDSGVALSDDEPSGSRDFLAVMSLPAGSASISPVCLSDGDREALATPGLNLSLESEWPTPEWNLDDDKSFDSIEDTSDVDKFILKTLAGGGKAAQEESATSKKPPGTPVKKAKTRDVLNFGHGERPWRSAIAKRVDDRGLTKPAGKGKAPRRSLPAAFTPLLRTGKKDKENVPLVCEAAIDAEDTDEDVIESPSLRKEVKRMFDGIGRRGCTVLARSNRPSKQNDSGICSSESEGSLVPDTPPSLKGADWQLGPPREFSSINKLNLPYRSISGSLTSTTSPETSPTATASKRRAVVESPLQESCGGKFERDFIALEEIGSGEFGKVFKARGKKGSEEEVFAIKRSRQFEGVKHQLRLREEVDILKHLWHAAQGRHANVLAYVDSWEHDGTLFIQTELCALGNFARFLWEYGRSFPRLDEARVWKIVVELSDGLRFIHDCGVLHLDFKPANIFVTAEGRFKIGDFGMATLWPRTKDSADKTSFEREGDKMYLAPEVLQGQYGKAADVFSLGMTVLETASNIVVPDQGPPWHRLRQEDFSEVDLKGSAELLGLIKSMMRTKPEKRVDMHAVCDHAVVVRTRKAMNTKMAKAVAEGGSPLTASALSGEPESFLEAVLGRRGVHEWI